MSKRCLHMMEKMSSSENYDMFNLYIFVVYCLFRFFVRFSSGLHGNTAADSVRSGWPLWHAAKSKTQSSRAGALRTETVETFELVKVKPKLLREKEAKGERERCAIKLPSEYHRQTYL
ncbi:hypothetical protein TNCV_1855291 [Trichonephila clavipes]|nr:hypothetical protein TNCV_1855291 [Trichonephila clavipes]